MHENRETSGARVTRAANENSQMAKTSRQNLAIPAGGPALVAASLCPGQEKRTIHKPEVQIGNSG
jgi:hypothetical protein